MGEIRILTIMSRNKLFSVVLLMVVCSWVVLAVDPPPEEDFAGYMDNLEKKQAEEAAAKEMLREHEVCY